MDTAIAEKCDIIGLSGLITPSLDEMAHVAEEMERRGLDLPLLIGGATTSREHTAVKIAPKYHASTVHVLDASRAGPGRQRAARRETATTAFDEKNRAEQEDARQLFAGKRKRPLLPFAEANARKPVIEWKASDICRRRRFSAGGRSRTNRSQSWCPTSTGPSSSRPGSCAESSRRSSITRSTAPRPASSYADGKKKLDELVKGKLIRASRGLRLLAGGQRGQRHRALHRREPRAASCFAFPMLRQQGGEAPYRCLADFVAPRESGLPDHVGAFAVTAGLGVDELAMQHQQARDDYSAIIVKALADRLAEAFAEMLHARARAEWGYGANENLSNEELDRRKVPRHPPRLRLPGLSRAQRRSQALRAAAGAVGRHHLDRELRHVARRQRKRHVPGPPSSRATSTSAVWPAIRWRATPPVKG